MPNLIGYVFEYKTIEKQPGGMFQVNFHNGISSSYPKDFENQSSFDCYPVYEGDFHDLFVDKSDVIRMFEEELEFFDDYDADHEYQSYSSLFQDIQEFVRYAAYIHVLARCGLARKKIVNESDVKDHLGLKSWKVAEYNRVSLERYNQELEEFLK